MPLKIYNVYPLPEFLKDANHKHYREMVVVASSPTKARITYPGLEGKWCKRRRVWVNKTGEPLDPQYSLMWPGIAYLRATMIGFATPRFKTDGEVITAAFYGT